MFKQLSEKKGTKGAVDPMQMKKVPLAQVPPKEQLPGTPVGEATSGDAQFIVTTLTSAPTGIDGSGPYLAVSPRTPYNRYPLPFMSLSGRLHAMGGPSSRSLLPPRSIPNSTITTGPR